MKRFLAAIKRARTALSVLLLIAMAVSMLGCFSSKGEFKQYMRKKKGYGGTRRPIEPTAVGYDEVQEDISSDSEGGGEDDDGYLPD